MSNPTDRAAAIARLTELGAKTAASADAEAPVTRTGNEIEAGGEEARLLIRPAHLSFATKDGRQYVDANVGDVVLLSKDEAKRLDAIGATVDPDTSDEEVAASTSTPGEETDEELGKMSAADLIAWLGQHGEHRERVQALELAKPEAKQRSTVLEASAPVE